MKLYLVPTPIGNLEDITLRAIRVLGEVDGILAEDTRNSGQLLKHLNISKPLYSHHAHNEHTGVPGVIKMLKEGKSLALISDAGTPGISDPGYLLVKACLDNGIELHHNCGAVCACSTCHLYINKGMEHLAELSDFIKKSISLQSDITIPQDQYDVILL